MYAKRVDEDQLITSAVSNLPPGIETVDLDLQYLSSEMWDRTWKLRASTLRSALFDNYPELRRVTCTIARRYSGFDWRRGGKRTKSTMPHYPGCWNPPSRPPIPEGGL